MTLFLALVVAIVVLTIVIILLLSNLGAYFTKIAQGTTVFINTGDTLRSIWPNVSGYRMSQAKDLDGQQWLIPEEDEVKRKNAFFHDSHPTTKWLQKLLWKRFGIRFISWFWPHNRVHSFDLGKGGRKRIKERDAIKENAPLRSRVVDSPEPTVVDSLLFTVPRPVFLEGVELAGDNSRINLLLLPIYRQVIPSLPVYNLQGDFFTPLDAAIEAAMVDFFASYRVAVHKKGVKKGEFAKDAIDTDKKEEELKEFDQVPLTYSLWLKLTKSGEDSPIERALRHLNASAEYREELDKKGGTGELVAYVDKLTYNAPASTISGALKRRIPSGIVPRFGFALVSFRVVEWEAHQSTVKLAEALLAKETKRHEAEGVREEAYGKRDATEALGKGESDRFDRMVAALVKNNVSPNVAAQVVATQLRMENVRGSKLTTYVEGGENRASVMVPAQASAPKPDEETV